MPISRQLNFVEGACLSDKDRALEENPIGSDVIMC
jgi:hypothetical protein